MVSIFISALAVAIAAGNFWIAGTKMRSDMYARRWEIYSSVMDYYLALLFWKASSENFDEQLSAQRRFIKSLHECRFLFAPKSGVYEIMTEMNQHAGKVRGIKELGPQMRSDPKLMHKWFEDVQTIQLSTMPDLIEKLRVAMGPYLNFHHRVMISVGPLPKRSA